MNQTVVTGSLLEMRSGEGWVGGGGGSGNNSHLLLFWREVPGLHDNWTWLRGDHHGVPYSEGSQIVTLAQNFLVIVSCLKIGHYDPKPIMFKNHF
jgi:hypothetical protein